MTARVATIRLSSLAAPAVRLDAKYYQEAFTLAKARVFGCGLPVRAVEEFADAFVPGRMALVTSRSSLAGAPYLRAHDAFDTLPESSRYIVASRTIKYEAYLLRRGMILTPSSGRNLGPLAFVGTYLAQFAMTDILRIVPRSINEGLFLLAYLMTATGQALIKRGRTGTTVDHLAPDEVLSIPVAIPDNDFRARIARGMGRVQRLLDEARLEIVEAEREFHECAGLHFESLAPTYYSSDGARTFTFHGSRLSLRLDAAYYDPLVAEARSAITRAGAFRIGDAADLRQLGRYKRYYVDANHGQPILSGSHLTQLHPVNLQHISDRSFRNPSAFVLSRGWTIFTCDGRSEESLAVPAYVSSRWDGWMASNHVMRAIPKPWYRPGCLYLALRSPFVQVQLKSMATGNVVDALDAETVSDLIIPALRADEREALGKRVEVAWEKVADAVRVESRIVGELESLIVSGYESRRS